MDQPGSHIPSGESSALSLLIREQERSSSYFLFLCKKPSHAPSEIIGFPIYAQFVGKRVSHECAQTVFSLFI